MKITDPYYVHWKISILVRKRIPFLEIVDDAIGRVGEGGIFVHINGMGFSEAEIESKINLPTFDDTYTTISISHLQTVFCLLVLGSVLAVACFVTEIMWNRYWTKRSGPTSTSVTGGQN